MGKRKNKQKHVRTVEAEPDLLDDKWFTSFWEAASGLSTNSRRVNPASAQGIAAVYACRSAICESVAMLPVSVINEVDERNKQKEPEHPLSYKLRVAPNPWMDSFEFFEVMQGSLLDAGNAYALIIRTRSGRIEALIPLDATQMRVEMTDNLELRYTYTEGAKTTVYTPDQILHVKYNSRDGILGRSPITVARETFGYSLNLLEHGAKIFENGAFLSGLIKAPFAFKDDETRERFINSFKKFMGVSNTGKFGVLEQGTDYVPFQMSNADAQFIEAKNASVIDICRIFRVPPVMAQVTDKGMSYSSIEQLSLIWIQYTIQPHCTRWERAIKRQLLDSGGDEAHFVRFNLSALVRGDLASRTQSLVTQLQYGLKTINEARHMLDENAIDDPIGDEVLLSHNLIPASQVGQEPKEQSETSSGALPSLASSATGQTSPTQPLRQTPTAERAAALEAEKPAACLTSLGQGKRFRPLFEELLGRLVRKEIRATSALKGKPNALKLQSEFYETHRQLMQETLSPAVQAWGGSAEQLEAFLDGYLEERSQFFISWPTEKLADDSSHQAEFLILKLEEH